jgi:hypothetical protein
MHFERDLETMGPIEQITHKILGIQYGFEWSILYEGQAYPWYLFHQKLTAGAAIYSFRHAGQPKVEDVGGNMPSRSVSFICLFNQNSLMT